MIREPYWTDCFTHSGNSALLMQPQSGHFLISAQCSVTLIVMGGISKTCLLSLLVISTSSRFIPQVSHLCTLWGTVSSGLSTILSVVPLWPFWPPGFLLLFFRRLFVLGFLFTKVSVEGGLLLLLLFLLRRSSKFLIFSLRKVISSSFW